MFFVVLLPNGKAVQPRVAERILLKPPTSVPSLPLQSLQRSAKSRYQGSTGVGGFGGDCVGVDDIGDGVAVFADGTLLAADVPRFNGEYNFV
jgi:hypothetical protein